MNELYVKIIIFPEQLDLDKEENYDEKIYGKDFSDLDDIRVNQVVGGYSILYKDELFHQLDTKAFADNIIQLFSSQLPDHVIKIEMYYFHMDAFNSDCAEAIVELDEYFEEVDLPDNITYISTENIAFILELHDADDDEDDEDNLSLRMMRELNMNIRDDDDDDDDYDTADLMRQLSRKRSYGRSRLIRSAKNAKRDINRHNFLICSDKTAKKHDEKIIKAFLKEFLPGDSKWIKRYRATILERWMAMFVMSKKTAKKMAESHKKRNGKGSSINKEGLVSFTKQLFTGYDPFYDPNR